jgi:Putative bacterial sensory transduction regulator
MTTNSPTKPPHAFQQTAGEGPNHTTIRLRKMTPVHEDVGEQTVGVLLVSLAVKSTSMAGVIGLSRVARSQGLSDPSERIDSGNGERTGNVMNETAWLRSHVERCLEDHWGDYPLTVDDDGDYPFRWGTAQGYVAIVNGDPHFIKVWAFVAQVPTRSLKLLSELNEINKRAMTVRVYWNGNSVIAEQTIHADGVTKTTLGQACLAVGAVADDVGVLLAAMFGGKTPFQAMDTEAQEEESC